MTQDEIIKMAKKADVWVVGVEPYQSQLERFAKLVADAERKACFYLVKNYIKETDDMVARGCLASVAYDIKARGQA